jgi:hypothetical protein
VCPERRFACVLREPTLASGRQTWQGQPLLDAQPEGKAAAQALAIAPIADARLRDYRLVVGLIVSQVGADGAMPIDVAVPRPAR